MEDVERYPVFNSKGVCLLLDGLNELRYLLTEGFVMRSVLAISLCLRVISSIAFADTFGTGSNQFTIDFVPISGSTNPTSGYGIVNNNYRMGKYEVTNAQWDKFKANIAPMQVTGSPSNAYDSDPYFPGTNVPTNCTSWYEAAQFVNWLNTSNGKSAAYKFTGTLGTGDYTLDVWSASDAGYNAANPYRNSNAFYFLPTEDEWVKAAYWNGSSLQTYANASAGDLVSGSPDPTKWNFFPSAGYEPWNATGGVQELNGTHNMMGNVWEWMESPYYTGDYLSGTNRGLRGGSYYDSDSSLSSSNRSYSYPGLEIFGIGFRVASIVPEPCSLTLLLLGGLALRYRKR
jgi:formylglycine-generating enzyme required for sulfatase activity